MCGGLGISYMYTTIFRINYINMCMVAGLQAGSIIPVFQQLQNILCELSALCSAYLFYFHIYNEYFYCNFSMNREWVLHYINNIVYVF